jgi:hypothetical protein
VIIGVDSEVALEQRVDLQTDKCASPRARCALRAQNHPQEETNDTQDAPGIKGGCGIPSSVDAQGADDIDDDWTPLPPPAQQADDARPLHRRRSHVVIIAIMTLRKQLSTTRALRDGAP